MFGFGFAIFKIVMRGRTASGGGSPSFPDNENGATEYFFF